MILPKELRRASYWIRGKKKTPRSRVLLRQCFGDDLQQYTSLIGQLSPVAYNDIVDLRASWTRFIASSHSDVFVVQKGKALIGCGTVLIEPKLSHGGRSCAHLEDIVVEKVYRCCGLGKIIIDHLLKVAQHAKCYKAVLSSNAENTLFYKKCGFREHEVSMRIDL